jgi:transcriptional accessory protein Tex/SPT6
VPEPEAAQAPAAAAEEQISAPPASPAQPVLRSLDDLREGELLTGRVKSLAAFGAFVDLGLRERKDGLIHISELADRRVGHPSEVVKVGQEVAVRVVGIDRARGRIGLTLRGADEPRDVPSSYQSAPAEVPPPPDEVTLESLVQRFSRQSVAPQPPPQRANKRSERERQEREEMLRRIRGEQG